MGKLITKEKQDAPADHARAELARILAGESLVMLPASTEKPPKKETDVIPAGVVTMDDWKRKKPAKAKTTFVRCILIDKYDHWHQNAMIDLKGKDTSAFTWGYYGVDYPVLIEQPDGQLFPFYLPDDAGESSNRLYKGAHPDGFRSTFKHRNSLLQKIQIGLMVGLVLGLFGIMFVLINF